MIDSGVGGLVFAKALRRATVSHDILVVADHAAAPYGPLTESQLAGRLSVLVGELLSYDLELIVLACNTATVTTISQLRGDFDVPFVGFEPAIKPAALASKNGSIGVLATAASIGAARFEWLHGRFADSVKLTAVAAPELVDLVEQMPGTDVVERVVDEVVRPLVQAEVDVVALACTHFSVLTPQIQRALGAHVKLVDPTDAVIARVLALAPPPDIDGLGLDYVLDTRPSRVASTLARWESL